MGEFFKRSTTINQRTTDVTTSCLFEMIGAPFFICLSFEQQTLFDSLLLFNESLSHDWVEERKNPVGV